MEKSNHVLLTGEGAERFAEQEGFELVENTYFHTPVRREEFERAKQKEAETTRLGSKIDPQEDNVRVRTAADSTTTRSPADEPSKLPDKFGTVGCVALDQQGNLAAATSTGGMAYKRFGRVGDSPIIGAGTYANNATCAVSATGWGEYFIRVSVARDIAAQMEYRGATIAEAAQTTLKKVARLGGNGGVICIDKDGNIALPFDTPGMYRGYRLSNGSAVIQLFSDER
jgi:beta-aspartyl-peptidase (threonine type)